MSIRHTAACLSIGAALAACSAPETEAPRPPAVLVRSVDAAQAAGGARVYTGEVRARVEAALGFRVGGKITARRVSAGDRVRRGEVLAELDPADARLAATAAAAAEAAAVADLGLARSELERAAALAGRNFISPSALDARRTAVQAAEARLRQARAEAAAAANLSAYTRLVADADGVVTGVDAEVGQVVAAGAAVVRVAQPGEREVLIHVPEGRTAAIAVGLDAEVRAWAAPGRVWAGRVREVAAAADAITRSYAVRVAVPDADAALPLGATASVVFAAASTGGVLLPLAAVTQGAEDARIWVVDAADTVRPLAVEVAAWREDGALVVAGLPDRARVVVAGVHMLIEGMAVRAVEEGAPVAVDVQR